MLNIRSVSTIIVAILISVPFLLGARSPSDWQQSSYFTPTQTRVIEFVEQHNYRFVQFAGSYRFFAPSFGCQSTETVYMLYVVSRVEGLVMVGVCTEGSGENQTFRPAPLRPVPGSYSDGDESDDDE
ncbi:hypothetical protein KKF05_03745 [Patescibacteria group bacterium]|nr:hypothetical protein [Patescibacteria group bacterium]MBU1916391.1 hypothetical protein [Patescibacteria group bacterium]